MTTARARLPPRTLLALGVLLLAGGIVSSFVSAQRMGVDFASLHLMGVALVRGINIYDHAVIARVFPAEYGLEVPPGMFYPPSTGFAMLPFAWLPYAAGKLAWLTALIAAIVLGIRELVRLAAPEAGSHVWMILSGLALFTSTVRWGMTPLQGAPLVFGLLCFFVAALHRNRTVPMLCIAAFAMAFKMTLALPFLGLLALYRHFFGAALVVGIWVGLNAIGMLRFGSDAFAAYRENMTLVESLYDINSPDPWFPKSIPRLDFVYFYFGVTIDLALSRLLSLASSALIALWLFWKLLRSPARPDLATTSIFLAAFVGLGSLCVYHHQYDLTLFIAPVLLAYFTLETPRPVWAFVLQVPLLLVMTVLPVSKVQGFLVRLGGPESIGLFNLMFPIVVMFSLAGVLAVLRVTLPRSARARP